MRADRINDVGGGGRSTAAAERGTSSAPGATADLGRPPMHILVNSDSLDPIGGISMSTLQLSREMVRRGHELTLLYRQGGELEEQYRAFTDHIEQVRSFHCRRATALRDLAVIWPAVFAARQAHADVIYLNRAEQEVWGLLSTLGVGHRGPIARVPLVCHLRHHPAGIGLRTLSRGVHRYISVSHYIKELWVEAGIDEAQIEVVHNGISLDDYPFGGAEEQRLARLSLGLPPEAPVALYYGRIDPEKGVDRLLQTWTAVRDRVPDATLVLMGGSVVGDDPAGYHARLRASAPPGCVWLPKSADVVPALHASDVVVLPATWQEPFGRVVIEGMATGRPVVATAVGGIPEILTGPFERFLAEPGDVDSLADRLAAALPWRRQEPELGKECRSHVEQHFTLRRTADSVERVLAAAVASNH